MSAQTASNEDRDWTRFGQYMSDDIPMLSDMCPDEANDAPYGGTVDAMVSDSDDASFAMNTSFLPNMDTVVSGNDEEHSELEESALLGAIFVCIMDIHRRFGTQLRPLRTCRATSLRRPLSTTKASGPSTWESRCV